MDKILIGTIDLSYGRQVDFDVLKFSTGYIIWVFILFNIGEALHPSLLLFHCDRLTKS